MYKILIIGGGGFLGFHLANFFLFKKIYKVDIIDNLSKGTNDKYFKTLLKEKNINFYKQDISKNEIKIKKKDYDYIFQFAALLGVDKVIKNPHEVLIKNVLIQKNAIEFAKKQKNLKKFIFSSTSEVHIGNEKKMLLKFPTPEDFNIILDDLSHPRSSYSLSKIYGEALLIKAKFPFPL